MEKKIHCKSIPVKLPALLALTHQYARLPSSCVETEPFDEAGLCDIGDVAQQERRLHVQQVDFRIGSRFQYGDHVLYRVICAG